MWGLFEECFPHQPQGPHMRICWNAWDFKLCRILVPVSVSVQTWGPVAQGEIFISFHPRILRCLQDALILAEKHQISPCRSALHPRRAGYSSAALYLCLIATPSCLSLSCLLFYPFGSHFPSLCFPHFFLYVSVSPCPHLSLHLSGFVFPCLSLWPVAVFLAFNFSNWKVADFSFAISQHSNNCWCFYFHLETKFLR